jgi:hypothetical protein
MKRVTLTLLLFTFAVGGSLAGIFSNSQIVYAQCSEDKKGKQITAGDGTLLCDCTVTAGFNCSCKVPAPCPHGEGDFIPEDSPVN